MTLRNPNVYFLSGNVLAKEKSVYFKWGPDDTKSVVHYPVKRICILFSSS